MLIFILQLGSLVDAKLEVRVMPRSEARLVLLQTDCMSLT
jgi:hypothetical protein